MNIICQSPLVIVTGRVVVMVVVVVIVVVVVMVVAVVVVVVGRGIEQLLNNCDVQ
jgi:hypothetical protein